MKKIILTLIIMICFVIMFGCANTAAENTKHEKMGTIRIEQVSSGEIGRTVMPSTADDQNFTDIVLKGKFNGESSTLADAADMEALAKSMGNITLSAGSWTFTLTANRYGASFRQVLNETVNADIVTTLRFNNMTLTAETADSGAVSVTVEFPHNLTYKIKSISAKLDNTEAVTLEMSESSYTHYYENDYYHSSWSTWYYKEASFYRENVTSGSHILTFCAKDASDDNVFTYPTYITVKKGFLSEDTIDLRESQTAVKNNTTSYTITYKPNNVNCEASDFVQRYYKGSSVISFAAAGFSADGYNIWKWNTAADGTGTSYGAGSMPTLYANMTLYAIWVNQNAKIVKYNDNFGESADGVLQSALDELQSPGDFGWSVTGCKFMGWDTSSDGSGTRYNAGAKFSMDGQPLTLYAQWCPYDSENDIYTIECIYDWNALFNGQDIYDMDVKLSTGLGDFVPDISFTNEKTFSGTFDGNGQTLYNMSKSLFAVNSGWIKNFTAAYKYAIDNSYIYIDDDASVARTNNGIISGITISTNINGTTSSENVGGICAVNNGTVTDCKVSGKVSNIYAVNVGGIAGNNTDVVTKCTASGTVSGLQNVGGIAGQNVDDVTYCHSSATVSSAGSASNIGGIVGYNYYNGSTTFGELQYCLSWATVQATASIENTNVGGLIGKSYMSSAKTTVNKCAFAGSLYGGKYQGGIIGYSYYSSVYYSYTATVDSKYYTAVGQPTGLTALYGYKPNGTWSNTFSSSENGTSLTCDVTSITSKLSSLNGTTPLWTANTGANGVSTKLKYEIVRPE